MDRLSHNIKLLNERIESALINSGRQRDEVKIVAATKTIDPVLINQLLSFSITMAGENRVQEFVKKEPLVTGIDWHFIGALQTNKVKYLIKKVSLIHSVDRILLIDEIQRQANKALIKQPILIQINAGEEDSKSGAKGSEQIAKLVEYTKQQSNIILKGFMAVFPKNAEKRLYKNVFEVFNYYKGLDSGIDILSMGMSDDIEIAIENGSTLIRAGRAIFCERNT